MLPAQSNPPPKAAIAPKGGRYRAAVPWLIGSGVLSGVATGGWFAYQAWFVPKLEPMAVMEVVASLGTVEVNVTEVGTVELGGQQTLKSPREVTVEQVNVQEGDRVQAGQPLIVLRDRTVQDNFQDALVENAKVGLDFERAQQKVTEAKAKLDLDIFDAERTRSREKITEVQAKLKAAEIRSQETQELVEKGYLAATDLQQDQDKLETLRAELKDAELNHRKVEQDLSNRLREMQSHVDDAQVSQTKAQLEVQKGQDKLSGVRQQLKDLVLTSPIAGIVLKLDVKAGDGAKTETSLLTLGDPTQEGVRLQLTTLNASRVRINQPANIRMIGPNAKTFTGRVVGVSPQATVAQSGGGFGDSGNQAKVDAQILLDRPSQTLIPGSSVSVEIITEQRRNVVTLPTEVIQRDESDRPFVWIRDPAGKAQKQSITLGLQGLQSVEIQLGLKANQPVVMPPPNSSIQAGVALTIGPPNELPPNSKKSP